MGSARALAEGQLIVDRLSKVYASRRGDGVVQALDDVTFELEPGESMALIGPNGAGKSTVLKVIAGVVVPSGGSVRRRGHTVSIIELGAGLHHDLTGWENLQMLLDLHRQPGRRPPRSVVDDIVEFSGLGSDLDRPLHQFSTGMIARLAFSVMAHTGPDILLIDEVLSVGDQEFQERCVELLAQLRRDGVSILLVSHDLGLVERVCRRCALLVDGQLVVDGDSEDVTRRYLGRPPRQIRSSGIGVRLEATRVDAGEDLLVQLDLPGGGPEARLRIEYVVPVPAGMEDRDSHMVAGRAFIGASAPGPASLRLGTTGLPAGAYELHLTLEEPARSDAVFASVPFALDGHSLGNSAQLTGELSIDGRPQGRF